MSPCPLPGINSSFLKFGSLSVVILFQLEFCPIPSLSTSNKLIPLQFYFSFFCLFHLYRERNSNTILPMPEAEIHCLNMKTHSIYKGYLRFLNLQHLQFYCSAPFWSVCISLCSSVYVCMCTSLCLLISFWLLWTTGRCPQQGFGYSLPLFPSWGWERWTGSRYTASSVAKVGLEHCPNC